MMTWIEEWKLRSQNFWHTLWEESQLLQIKNFESQPQTSLISQTISTNKQFLCNFIIVSGNKDYFLKKNDLESSSKDVFDFWFFYLYSSKRKSNCLNIFWNQDILFHYFLRKSVIAEDLWFENDLDTTLQTWFRLSFVFCPNWNSNTVKLAHDNKITYLEKSRSYSFCVAYEIL